ncbi:uncharacterized protein LOC134216036 isoform X2 [Armigeres subalbatus]|uniref:uncharacterized protein LOC134216036 isoform X2 n=1 Tax=Armigeres subalbatus TaxID=124917 RepID=UPI002ED3950D
MNLLYLLLFIHIYLSPRLSCFRSSVQNNRKQPIESNYRKNSDRFHDDSYVYSADYADSEASVYEKNTDSDSLQTSRAQKRSSSETLGDIVDLTSFSDAEVSLALSMLTERELDHLDQLMSDDRNDVDEMMAKRETNAEKKKRECQGESCNESSENEQARFSRDVNSENNQIASFRSWFSKSKTTKITKRPTRKTVRTTKRPSVRTTHRKTVTKPTRRRSTAITNRGHTRQMLLSNNNDILRYGSNDGIREIIDKNVKNKIDLLTNKIKKRDETHSSANKRYNQDFVIRRKRNSISPEFAGTLDDSFPHPNRETGPFHEPLGPLIRVKRILSGV